MARIAVPAVSLGRPTGPRLRDLTITQEHALNDWLSWALRHPPRRWDELPTGFTRALATLARRRGIRFVFDGARRHERGHRWTVGKGVPGCVGGSKRDVRAADNTLPSPRYGSRVEPWNEHAWRGEL